MIEIPPYISIFFNFHLHDEHDFGSFPIYVGFAEAIWTCDGGRVKHSKQLTQRVRWKKGILSPQRDIILKIKIMRRHKNEYLLFLTLWLNESILIRGIKII